MQMPCLDRIRTFIQRPPVEIKRRQIVPRQLLRVAAVFLAVAIVGGLLFLSLHEHENPICICTAYGKTERITLPDQSVVLLNANSVLSYNDKWTDNKTREVWLAGEAYFEVKKSDARGNAKFVVHTDQLSVEVLGTEFNVNNRRGKTQVVLNAGKVRLTSDTTLEKEIIMAPGERWRN